MQKSNPIIWQKDHQILIKTGGYSEFTIGGTSVTHSFFICEHLTKDLITGLDMQLIYRLGCDWTAEGKLYLHQGYHVFATSLNVNTNNPKLQTLRNTQIPT